jgi:AcrR family transcriptional regulator
MSGGVSPEVVIRDIGCGPGPLGASPRERVLMEAFVLFYAHGIRAVGVDLVIARSGVAKATFYRHFPSKNDLVIAYLDRRQRAWFTWLTDAVASRATAPLDRLLAIFDVLGEQFADPDFRGSAVINAVAEVGSESPAVVERARAHDADFRAYVRALAEDAGLPGASDVADHWALLIDGAFAAAQRRSPEDVAASTRRAAELLLAAGGRRAASRATADRTPAAAG